MINIGSVLIQIISTFITIVIIGVLIAIVAVFFVRKLKRKKAQEEQYQLTFLHVKLPQNNENEIINAENMFASFMALENYNTGFFEPNIRISFEIVSNSEGIGFYVVVPDEVAVFAEKQINAAYPDAEIDIIDPNEVWDRGQYTSVAEMRLAGPHYYPIKMHEEIGSDALSSITGAMSKLSDTDVLALQIILQPASEGWRAAGRNFVFKIKGKAALQEGAQVDTSLIEGVEKKVGKPGFYTKVRVVSIAQDQTSAQSHVNELVNTFSQFTNVTFNRFVRKGTNSSKFVDDFIYRRMNFLDLRIPVFGIQLYKNVSVLNIEELATIFHFPNQDIKTPKILWLRARKAAAPINLPKEGLYMGKSVFRGSETKVFIKETDRRRHMYIIGQTGTGKSEFLKAMALQDIANGKGLAVVDPHGSMVEDLLQKIPEHRIDDVIVFDASEQERPFGLNILEAKSEDEKNVLINAFIGLLYKLYDPNRTGIIGPKLERAVRNVMLTAMADQQSTLVDVLRLLIDTEYSKKFMPLITDPLVKRYWIDEVANTSAFHKSESMGYFVSKFDRFITERSMRNMLGQPTSSINFPAVMEHQKILLVDLSKGKIGEENSTFLGLIIVPRILMAALARARQIEGGQDFPDFYLYVDEFQNFATPDFATILSEARKYKLDLIVANQFIAQLTDDIRDAVFGNVGSLLSFRVGNDDAEYLEKLFTPAFEAPDLMNNAMGNAYLRLLIDGHPSEPFSMRVDWDSARDDISTDYVNINKNPANAKRIRELSRQTYGRPRAQVEEYISKRAGFDSVESPVPPVPPQGSTAPPTATTKPKASLPF